MTAVDIRPLAEVIDFPGEHEPVEPPANAVTHAEAMALAGVSYRQLDYWERTGIVTGIWPDGRGSGRVRYFARSEVAVMAVTADLVHAGMDLRIAVVRARELLEQGVTYVAGLALRWADAG